MLAIRGGGRAATLPETRVELTALAKALGANAQAPRAEALRMAQVGMIEGTLGGGRWAHPFYWAGYALFGDPSR